MAPWMILKLSNENHIYPRQNHVFHHEENNSNASTWHKF